jgi:hypothetical protein
MSTYEYLLIYTLSTVFGVHIDIIEIYISVLQIHKQIMYIYTCSHVSTPHPMTSSSMAITPYFALHYQVECPSPTWQYGVEYSGNARERELEP